jgi:Skp family chaperone for outer membrane proteins
MRTFGLLARPAGALVILAASAAGALAQTPTASNTPTYGPPIPGVCVFSRDVALNTSQAGVSANQQIQKMEQDAEATIGPERTAITEADKALSAEKPKLAPAKYQERAAALQQRVQAYSVLVQTRNAQFSHTHDKAMSQIAQAVTPILVATITDHKCSLVVERGGIYGANPAMDLTPEVVQKLNAVLPTITVTLEPPPSAQR